MVAAGIDGTKKHFSKPILFVTKGFYFCSERMHVIFIKVFELSYVDVVLISKEI